jgi:hypothetical protein
MARLIRRFQKSKKKYFFIIPFALSVWTCCGFFFYDIWKTEFSNQAAISDEYSSEFSWEGKTQSRNDYSYYNQSNRDQDWEAKKARESSQFLEDADYKLTSLLSACFGFCNKVIVFFSAKNGQNYDQISEQ